MLKTITEKRIEDEKMFIITVYNHGTNKVKPAKLSQEEHDRFLVWLKNEFNHLEDDEDVVENEKNLLKSMKKLIKALM